MANPFSLQGKRALIVGADSGIGLACARALAAAGAKVALAGLKPVEGAVLVRDIEASTGETAAYFEADVRDEAAVADVGFEIGRRLSGGGLDIADQHGALDRLQPRQGHLGPRCGQSPGAGQTDTGIGPDDQGPLALQAER